MRTCRTSPMSTRHEQGYTLVEMAVVMSVFVVFMSFASPFIFSQLNAGIRAEERIDLQDSARSALRTMTRELRQASELYNTPGKPTDDARLSFGVDLDGNGSINDYQTSTILEQITYFASEGTLYRSRNPGLGQGAPLAEDVESVEFTKFGSNLAFDSNGDGVVSESELNPDATWTASELANVTRIQVELSVQGDEIQQTFSAAVVLRNRMLG
jgi:prepilin-type N-terminal cleavage/methylation domain-containing protein